MNSGESPDRGEEIQRLYLAAYQAGLATDRDRVARNLAWYRRWYRGHISLGQLINRTGVKMRPKVTMQRRVDMTSDGTTVMVDTIHDSVGHVPTGLHYVGGYVSGTPDIKWTPEDWSRFPESRHIRIFQGHGDMPDLHSFDAIDVESGAVTPAEAASIVRTRVMAGIPWTHIYGTDAVLETVSEAIRAYGQSIWNGHVSCWLADWNLDESEATAKIGTRIHGMTCVAVQWASPSSNPHTLIPGTQLTLREANCDLSVVDATWIPSGGWGLPPKPVTPPTQATMPGWVIYGPALTARKVVSADGGVTWH